MPLCASFGTDRDEVGRELDFAVLKIDRVREIDDALVVRIGNREREEDASGDALVGPGVAEGLAVEDVDAGGDFYAGDAGGER